MSNYKEQPEEKILIEVSPSNIIFLGGYILCTIGFFLIIPIFIMIYNYLRIKTTKYTISTQRIRIRYGILNKITDEIELYRILDYKIKEPLWLRVFGLANIELNTMDQTHPVFTIYGIKNAVEINDNIRKYSEITKSNAKISEMDVSGFAQ